MKKLTPLSYKFFRKYLNPSQLSFKTTDELAPLTEFIWHERAVSAINFGIGIASHGYNIFLMGSPGLGKRSLIRSILKPFARTQKPPPDWCYIYNFEVPEKPIAIDLPAGLGSILQKDMNSLINELKISILTVFESDEYRTGMQEIINEFNYKRENIIEKSKEGKIPHLLYRERHEKEKALQLKLTLAVVRPYIDKLRNKYESFLKIVSYLDAVQADIVTHVNDFIKRDEKSEMLSFDMDNPILVRYQINLLVNNGKRKGVPIILEENPTYTNLICLVEYKPQSGAFTTDFTLIRPGALHRANGGFLIIEARKIKNDKHAWESLKRVLYSGKIKIEAIEHITESIRPVSLKPQSIPLNIKIILLGDRYFYYKLCRTDQDFIELFKVPADLDEQIERDEKNIELYARLISTFVKKKKLRPFDASAVATIIDHCTRLAEDVEKLTTHIRRIEDLIQEANYWAGLSKKKIVDASDVEQASKSQIYRMDRSRELYYEDINRDFILIRTEGEAIGQVNCLSVVKAGNFSYGHPTRITAKVRAGKGKIIDIQREIHLAGPIHSKAGLIIANFLADRYSRNVLFSLTASLAFEQIYGMLEGDSASVGELCALLSALADVPIKQTLAVTGSINQYGEVQSIGCVNEKIEGYFDICKTRGLTGTQGVLIPAINIKNLMLREDVVAAAKAKQFFVYPIETVDQAITLLTGVTAGDRNRKNGQFPKASVNYKVEARLNEFSQHRLKSIKSKKTS